MRPSLAFLVLALPAALPAAAGATWPGKPAQIVYHALDDDDEGARDGVYSIRPDGSLNRRIIRRAVGEVASSRNGERIAFFRTEGQLWQARSDGSRARRIVRLQDGSGSDPAWSPSGERLVFTVTVAHDVEVEEIWVVRRDGTGLRKLHSGHGATWSSKGLIAYADEDGAVATIRPDGTGRQIWVPQGSPVVATELDFSPDGRRVAYLQSTRQGTKDTIRTVDLRTGRRTSFRNLTKHVYTFRLAWAPSNHRLAYVHTDIRGNDPPQLRTIRPEGTGRRTLFAFPSGLTPFGFAWQTR
jgi:Tol biopolymer transport system component